MSHKESASVPDNRIALTVEEAARRISTNDKQIRRAIHAGELRAKKLGKSWVIPVAALTAWVNAQS